MHPELPGNDEEFKFVSPEHVQITDRNYEQYLTRFALDETMLYGKTILDVGAGLATFVDTANERLKSEGATAWAVDPIYALAGKTYEEFTELIKNSGLGFSPGYAPGCENILSDGLEGLYDAYKNRLRKSPSSYIAGSHQELPFADGSIDLILAHNSITVFDEDIYYQYNAMRECLRVIAEHGEVRLTPVPPSFYWQSESDLKIIKSSDPEDARAVVDGDPNLDYVQLVAFQALQQRGAKIYLEAVQRGSAKGNSSLILRKDDAIPEIKNLPDLHEELLHLDFSGDIQSIQYETVWRSDDAPSITPATSREEYLDWMRELAEPTKETETEYQETLGRLRDKLVDDLIALSRMDLNSQDDWRLIIARAAEMRDETVGEYPPIFRNCIITSYSIFENIEDRLRIEDRVASYSHYQKVVEWKNDFITTIRDVESNQMGSEIIAAIWLFSKIFSDKYYKLKGRPLNRYLERYEFGIIAERLGKDTIKHVLGGTEATVKVASVEQDIVNQTDLEIIYQGMSYPVQIKRVNPTAHGEITCQLIKSSGTSSRPPGTLQQALSALKTTSVFDGLILIEVPINLGVDLGFSNLTGKPRQDYLDTASQGDFGKNLKAILEMEKSA
ncbi:MAG: methyltransferase domain-containing protein [Candidatus Berkelbacteria bacterium]|nr:methyltransferase domain-containing protein [Candidatus Berkelbacteria bacterium]